MNDIIKIQEIMADFANRTGLITGNHVAKRYLWTNAFAVCNFLELFHQTGEERYKQEAFALVDQVHVVLGTKMKSYLDAVAKERKAVANTPPISNH